jgi:hypothetical protein
MRRSARAALASLAILGIAGCEIDTELGIAAEVTSASLVVDRATDRYVARVTVAFRSAWTPKPAARWRRRRASSDRRASPACCRRGIRAA